MTKDEFTRIGVRHKFEKEGTFTVTEKISSDDLASPSQLVYKEGQLTSPTITVTGTITVGHAPPTASFTSRASALVGEAVAFTNHSSDPNGGECLPLAYSWSFGDGSGSASASPSHAYAAAGHYTVKLTVANTCKREASTTHEIAISTVESPPPPPPPPPPLPPPPGGGVLSYNVSVAGASVAVSRAGSLSLKINCSGQSSCAGTVTLRTASAVSASSKHKSILTLASASFTITGGQVKSVSLHLSAKARALLKRVHTLKARATITARDSSGTSHTTTALITLKASKHR